MSHSFGIKPVSWNWFPWRPACQDTECIISKYRKIPSPSLEVVSGRLGEVLGDDSVNVTSIDEGYSEIEMDNNRIRYFFGGIF